MALSQPSAAAAPKRENTPPAGGHRVVLGWWPIIGGRATDDPRTASLAALVNHCRASGYDGAEMSAEDIRSTFGFPSSTPLSSVVAEAKAVAPRGFFTGGTYHLLDGNDSPYDGLPGVDPSRPVHDWSRPNWRQTLRAALQADVEMGCHYANFQIFLPPRHLNTGGEYRNDEAYLSRCAEGIAELQALCFELGLNCYVETHIDRLSEDLEAFGKIMDRAPYFELNADLSHYYYRGITKGPQLERIWPRVGHMHARMARQHGDLSADVPDPVADWEAKGVTYQSFEYYKPALEGGLSSRVIMGESGPMHLVTDSLTLDAKLVPLWRAMAEYADAHSGAGAGPSYSRGPSAAGGTPGSATITEAEANNILESHWRTQR